MKSYRIPTTLWPKRKTVGVQNEYIYSYEDSYNNMCVSGRQRWLYVDLPQGEIAGPLCRMKENYISDAIHPWKAVLQKFLWQSECKELTMSECKQCVI